MSKDPAFLFYPGDYLRDTQCLSEKVQVAYDRIMCEHMRNICISKKQLKFFTKKLSDDEIEELEMVLTEIEGGYQITWVAESIDKRRKYSESRRNNRKGNKKNISKSYDTHMENEIVNENKSIIVNKNKGVKEKVKELPNHIQEFVEYRKSIKKPFRTTQQLEKFLKKLVKHSEGDLSKQIEIIDNTIANGWIGIFPIDQKANSKTNQKNESVDDVFDRILNPNSDNQKNQLT